MEKLLFPVAVHFKGSGFYSTDYGARKVAQGLGLPSSSEKTTDKPAEKAATEKKSSGDSAS